MADKPNAPLFEALQTYTDDAAKAKAIVAAWASGRTPKAKGVLAFAAAANPNTVDAYVQFFDAALAATPTLGTTEPIFVLHVPAGISATVTGMASDGPGPLADYNLGLVYACTTTPKGATESTTALTLSIGCQE